MSSSNEYNFTISVTGSSGEQYRGAFKVKVRLSHRDTLRMDNFRRDLLGPNPEGQNPESGAQATARVFSKVWTHILEAPDWWKASGNGLDLPDEEPVMEILKQIQERVEEANGALQKEAATAEKELKEEVKKA